MFEDSGFPVGREELGTGSDVMIFIPGIPFSRKRTGKRDPSFRACPGKPDLRKTAEGSQNPHNFKK